MLLARTTSKHCGIAIPASIAANLQPQDPHTDRTMSAEVGNESGHRAVVGKAGSGDEPFGALLRNYRAAANMTQEELAERSGLSVHAIGMLERGIRLAPRASTVDLLAEALKLDASQRQTLVTAARRKHDSPAPAAVIPPELRAFGSWLIGRERELDAVTAFVESITRGPRALLLEGEAADDGDGIPGRADRPRPGTTRARSGRLCAVVGPRFRAGTRVRRATAASVRRCIT